ncbi:hypothetical protein [Longispora urticae]
MSLDPTYFSILVFDIESFGRRSDTRQLRLRAALYGMAHRILDPLCPAGAAPHWQDRGDGFFVLVPTSVSKVVLLGDAVRRFDDALRAYNADAEPDLVMRVRLAVHAGEVVTDPAGYVGTELNTACRLVDAEVAKRCLTDAPRALLVVIASDPVYQGIIRHGYPGVDAQPYHPARVSIKELDDVAWLRVPGMNRPPGDLLPPPAPPAPTPPPSGGGGVTFNAAVAEVTVGTKNVYNDGTGRFR